MSLKIHTLIRHIGCAACTEVEENYLDLESSVGLMYTVGEVVQRRAEKAHGPVRVHNFSLARRRRATRNPNTRSASSSAGSGSSSIETGTPGEDEKQEHPGEPVDGVPGSPAEPAAGGGDDDDDKDDDNNSTGDEGEEAKTAGGGGKQPGRLCDITAVVDWTTPPEAQDALGDMDMLRLLDHECRELRAHLRSRAMCDLIVLEYSLET